MYLFKEMKKMTGFDFTVGLNFGQITEAQMVRIENALKDSQILKVISTPTFLLFDDGKGTQVSINPQFFNFKIAREYEEDELVEHKKVILEIINSLMGNNDMERCTIRFVNVFESDEEKAFEVLKEKTKFDLSHEQLKDIQTVGYRFLMKTDSFYDEFKIEPLLKEPEKLFIEGIYNRMNIPQKEAIKSIDDAYNNYKEKEKLFIEAIS